MATDQTERHRKGRLGVKLAKEAGVAKGREMPHNHPFDLLDTLHGTADEVKLMVATPDNGESLNIHIDDKSLRRKLDYMKKHRLQGSLVLVLVDENEQPVAFYKGRLQKHARPSGLEKVK
jgi:hypothetical protein